MTNPVTHTADVEVNRASKNGVTTPCCEEMGSIRRRLPAKITRKNPKIITRNGDLLFLCNRRHISLLSFFVLIRLYFCFILSLSTSGLKRVLTCKAVY